MSKSPENRYVDKVHRQLHPHVWSIRMQMGLGAPRGIPDMLYRGQLGDLWIEYKWIEDWDKRRTVPLTKLSAHQIVWLQRAVELNGPNTHAVVIGDSKGKGCYILAEDIETKISASELNFYTPKEMAAKIHAITGYH